MEDLRNALLEMQNKVIGIFVHYGHEHLILEINDDGMMKTFNVGTLLGLQLDTLDSTNMTGIRLFPDSKSLTDMMEDPHEFTKWYRENVEPFK